AGLNGRAPFGYNVGGERAGLTGRWRDEAGVPLLSDRPALCPRGRGSVRIARPAAEPVPGRRPRSLRVRPLRAAAPDRRPAARRPGPGVSRWPRRPVRLRRAAAGPDRAVSLRGRLPHLLLARPIRPALRLLRGPAARGGERLAVGPPGRAGLARGGHGR